MVYIYCGLLLCLAVFAAYWVREALRLRESVAGMRKSLADVMRAKHIEVVADPNCPPDKIFMLLTGANE